MLERNKNEKGDDSEEEGSRHFMVNIIEPQFNLHSEDANGRFLLTAASGCVLSRPFHSILRVGSEACDMFLRFTRHKSGTPELKVKPLKDLSFNSQSITMSMTSHQFQVMLDVLTNLLFARAPKYHLYRDDDIFGDPFN
ncbi:hypothetical protein V6N11_042965 [Hibiscus sabdariffa]|uniref:Uncharacterized protein n=1 Tax=Hibiscus sabdariffa TaxID=183260 RepID=A0ABR2QXV6_9ROSI